MTPSSNEPAAGTGLRIALVTERFGRRYGGAEAYAVALARELSHRHDVTIVCRDYLPLPDAPLRYLTVPPGPARPTWLRSWRFARHAWQLTRQGYDIVHSHINGRCGDVEVIHVIPVRYRWRVQMTGLRRWLSFLSPRVQAYLHLERQRAQPQPGRRIVPVSDTIAQQWAAAYIAGTDLAEKGVAEKGVRPPFHHQKGGLTPFSAAGLAAPIPPGVDVPDADLRPRREALRARLGLGEHDCLCLLVARNPLRKGLRTLLAALATLPAHYRLAVVGGRDVASQVDLTDAGIADAGRVHFADTTPDVGDWYAAADLYVHPTLADSFGMAPLEAMAHRVPVVISPPPWCGFAAELTHGRDAWILPHPEDAGALAQALRTLGEDAVLRNQLSAGGLAQAQRHAWSAVAQQYEALYRELIAERLGHPPVQRR